MAERVVINTSVIVSALLSARGGTREVVRLCLKRTSVPLVGDKLRDEADNPLIELAIAGGATLLVTNNPRDFRGDELRFPQLRAATPGEFSRK